MIYEKLAFVADKRDEAFTALQRFQEYHNQVDIPEADVIIVLGGDGFMLDVLNEYHDSRIPFYGINRGTVGFLMNQTIGDNLIDQINLAEETVIHPLKMEATRQDGNSETGFAINEVSILRSGSQAAKLKISVDSLVRMRELVCDGALVSTPAGSTAYNYSAHGPILPLGSNILALTAMAAFRPRRWRGALIPSVAKIEIDILESEKRPVSAFADGKEVSKVLNVKISTEEKIAYRLLFDPGHGLQERILQEQFV